MNAAVNFAVSVLEAIDRAVQAVSRRARPSGGRIPRRAATLPQNGRTVFVSMPGRCLAYHEGCLDLVCEGCGAIEVIGVKDLPPSIQLEILTGWNHRCPR